MRRRTYRHSAGHVRIFFFGTVAMVTRSSPPGMQLDPGMAIAPGAWFSWAIGLAGRSFKVQLGPPRSFVEM